MDNPILQHLERQTKALETLQLYAFWWTVLAAMGAAVLLIIGLAS